MDPRPDSDRPRRHSRGGRLGGRVLGLARRQPCHRVEPAPRRRLDRLVSPIRRRDLIGLFAGGAAAWPLVARAQQKAMPVIGFLHLTSLETNRENLAVFRRGLGVTGYIEDKNVAIEYRWAQGRNDQLPTLAAELVHHEVSVIVVLESTNGALAAKAATQTIPIAFMQGADPVRIGLVDRLDRPGGNLTGIGLLAAETAGKCLELLLELVPAANSIAYLRNPTNPVFAESETREVQVAARAHGVRLLLVNASSTSEIETAFADLVQQRADALQVSSDGFLSYPSRSNRRAGGPPCRASDLRLAPIYGSRPP